MLFEAREQARITQTSLTDINGFPICIEQHVNPDLISLDLLFF